MNNRIIYHSHRGEITLFLPNGGTRRYLELKNWTNNQKQGFFCLTEEILPSQHRIKFEYDKKDRLKHIALTNPAGNKTLAWIHFDLIKTNSPFHFQARTSDGKIFNYHAMEHKEREYINSVQSNSRFAEQINYQEGRAGTGARLGQFCFDGKMQFSVEYYLPPNKKAEDKWRDNPDKKEFSADKIQSLKAPAGPNGEFIEVARFTYKPGQTDVWDVDNILTRFHHSNDHLTAIEYFDEKNQLHSMIQFIWDGNKLKAKVFLNEQRLPIFSRTFQYDTAGNVTEEKFWGNISGKATGPFQLDSQGNLIGAEGSYKRYSYLPQFNLPLLEEGNGTAVYRYTYKSGTDLLTSKLTCDKDKIVRREFFLYNEDNILTTEIIDNGSSSDIADLTNVTHRQIKRYQIDSNTCLVQALTEAYLDPHSKSEIVLKRIAYTYSPENRVIAEAVYDAEGSYRYTLKTDYDSRGHVILKTNPLGQESRYFYDPQGHLLTSEEPGSPKKIFTYDAAGRPRSCEEIDPLGKSKVSYTDYDAKGRPICQLDNYGNATYQNYDAFGRCLSTQFPEVYDEQGKNYKPFVQFTYDAQGNLSSYTTPREETTQNTYNALRKPIHTIHPDGNHVRHFYNTDGTLSKTIYVDGTETHYTYDIFQRTTSSKIYSENGNLLSSQSWEYDAFQLLSHTDTLGLTTTYSYDFAGRKIAEQAEDRLTAYTYDSLGFTEKTTKGEITHVEIHDDAGRITQQWDEDQLETIENFMIFSYDNSNRKEKARRTTSQGDALDLFSYDGAGRLSCHTDPYRGVTQFLYSEEYRNDLGQQVLQKTTIDPLGNMTVETYDAQKRPTLSEKKDPQGRLLSKEQWLYDRSGNKAKRITTVFHSNQPVKVITSIWEYDTMGRVLHEIEAGQKITSYTYDVKGRLEHRILPSGITITYAYDSIDRLIEMKSSDKTVHYSYVYDLGPDPTEMIDHVQGCSLKRRYNVFGELIKEMKNGFNYQWKYDSNGRCEHFILPDDSSIAYHYCGLHLESVSRFSSSEDLLYQHQYSAFDPNGHVAKEELIANLGSIITQRDLMERPLSQASSWCSQAIAYNRSSLVEKIDNSLFGQKIYSYDALDQLVQEGEKEYHFDSIGNSTQDEVNDLNQIITTGNDQLIYDLNGNPIKRITLAETITYKYDALGRLTTIISPNRKNVHFTYDPLSRLHSKIIQTYQRDDIIEVQRFYYIYDQEKEIGIAKSPKEIVQLKVLGLGIREDIGAAIALELDEGIFAPLHDFQGNIIALIDIHRQLVETYPMDAFGRQTSPSSISPWRFASKRTEEGLIFFGKRFYDPSLGRWLTPDPSGFSDGPNLYAYVLNNPPQSTRSLWAFFRN